MDCASCAFAIETATRTVPGVKSASVNPASEKLFVESDNSVKDETIVEAIHNIGYVAIPYKAHHNHNDKVYHDHQNNKDKQKPMPSHDTLKHAEHDHAKMESDKEIKILRYKMWFGVFVSVVVMLIMFGGPLVVFIPASFSLIIMAVFATAVEFWVGKQFWKGMYFEFKRLRPGMDSLVALGTGAAYIFSVIIVLMRLVPQWNDAFLAQFDPYFDVAVVVTTFIVIGKYLEAKAKGYASEAIKKLLSLQAKTAHKIRPDGKVDEININDVALGDVLLVKQGEKIPVDGIIVEGNASIDESMITGESLPVDRKKDDEVIGSSVIQSGIVKIQATKIGAKTFLAQMVRIVEEAQSSKAPIQKLADTITQYFVPVVLLIAVVTFVIWFMWGPSPSLSFAFINAVAVLVVACPCALGLATPISVITGTGKGAQYGIIVRSASSLEHAGKINAVVLDKTGTITQGKPSVADVVLAKIENQKYPMETLLRIAAGLSTHTTHPLDEAIVHKAQEEKITPANVSDFRAITGKGIVGIIDAVQYALGNEKIAQEVGVVVSSHMEQQATSLHNQGKTPLFLMNKQEIIGLIGIADTLKSTAKETIAKLHALNIAVWMITGDNERTAQAIAQRVGITNVYASVLPEQKSQKIQELQNQGKVVAMVGDGVNDAPALTQADIGIAIGTGTDIAIESAGITLASGDPLGVWRAIILSRRTLSNIKQNLFWAYAYNIALIPVAAGALYPIVGVLLNPVLAGAAMAFSSLSVVLNALRLKKVTLS